MKTTPRPKKATIPRYWNDIIKAQEELKELTKRVNRLVDYPPEPMFMLGNPPKLGVATSHESDGMKFMEVDFEDALDFLLVGIDVEAAKRWHKAFKNAAKRIADEGHLLG